MGNRLGLGFRQHFARATGKARRRLLVALVVAGLSPWLIVAGAQQSPVQPSPAANRTLLPLVRQARTKASAVTGGDPVLVGAGDIAVCSSKNHEATARLLDRINGIVMTLGDHAYESGTTAEFTCYDRSWGRHKDRTRPAPGNHEYFTPNAAPYYAYFGAAAGDPQRGYYSYDLGVWHIVVLNTHCNAIGGCEATSSQLQWLVADLLAHPTKCTLAYWHRPRFGSGTDVRAELEPIWQALYDAGTDVVVNGHAHGYERLAPLDPLGNLDRDRGIRSFIVGTGGAPLYPPKSILPITEVHSSDTYGVLKLTLRDTTYDWEFVPVPGSTFKDAGTGSCH